MTSPSDEILLCAVGDVAPSRADPDSLFTKVAPVLQQADIAFCQLEINLTARGSRLPQVRHTDRTSAEAAHAIRRAGFNVVSFASNHCMDWGTEGLLDTIAALDQAKLGVIGVGPNITRAREPVILTRKDQRIAFLAYCSILPMCYWAEPDRAGCAPMRAWTHYEQVEPDQPGTPCRIHTYPNRDDVDAMRDDIARVRAIADVVVVSQHWGIHFIPAVIADYQRDIARAAIDAGADLILGHHAHILKGFEMYRGKPVFYSLCNFAVDLPMDERHAQSKGFREIQKLHPNWQPDFTSTYNFPPESRRTIVVKCRIAGGKLAAVSLLPTYVSRQSQPEILAAGDPRFGEVADYLADVTRTADLNGRFRIEGDELVVDLSG